MLGSMSKRQIRCSLALRCAKYNGTFQKLFIQYMGLITLLKSEDFARIEKGLFFKGGIPLIDSEEHPTF